LCGMVRGGPVSQGAPAPRNVPYPRFFSRVLLPWTGLGPPPCGVGPRSGRGNGTRFTKVCCSPSSLAGAHGPGRQRTQGRHHECDRGDQRGHGQVSVAEYGAKRYGAYGLQVLTVQVGDKTWTRSGKLPGRPSQLLPRPGNIAVQFFLIVIRVAVASIPFGLALGRPAPGPVHAGARGLRGDVRHHVRLDLPECLHGRCGPQLRRGPGRHELRFRGLQGLPPLGRQRLHRRRP